MSINEVRKKFLEYFAKKGHAVVPSASLIPENDPTTLFTGSGMQPLISYFLGEKHPLGNRLVNSQKCFRAEDIEEVGDNRHTTFFEMLGNWSLGDYFKKEQLAWFFDFLTKEIGLNPSRLYVTVYAGDPHLHIPRDDESALLWKELFAKEGIEARDVELVAEEKGSELGMQNGRIFYYRDKNWWSRWGLPSRMPVGEPGGPDSEVFYDFETPHDPVYGKHCHPNCNCGRFLEIGNSVFMEYQKMSERRFEKLLQKNVDFGGGLERIAAAANNDPDIFHIDAFSGVIGLLLKEMPLRAKRIIADHMRASVFLIQDGVRPSNKERGYVLRRLMRRAMVHARVDENPAALDVGRTVDVLKQNYEGVYSFDVALTAEVFREEQEKFAKTLRRGLKELVKIESIDARAAFWLYETFGVPYDVIKDPEISGNKAAGVTREAFDQEFKKHQEDSRTASAGAFKGGLVDHQPKTIRHHTAHHLLLAALRMVLGGRVFQRGSNVSSERLRIDFSHPEKMTPEQILTVEKIVNEAIQSNLEVRREEMPKVEAEQLGALREFGAKYGDIVSVYTIYNKDGSVFSREFCGGPHVAYTGEIGHFKILKEESSSSGVRRIKASIE